MFVKNPEFWVCRHKCRGIAVALPSKSRGTVAWKFGRELPRGGPRHWSGKGRGIDLQNAIFRVLRLGNGVLMSGIDTTTLNSVERCPRHLIMDLNPIRPVLTHYL